MLIKEIFNINEKAKSEDQQQLMGMAYAYKKGELSSEDVSQQVVDLANSMSMDDLKDYAGTKHNET